MMKLDIFIYFPLFVLILFFTLGFLHFLILKPIRMIRQKNYRDFFISLGFLFFYTLLSVISLSLLTQELIKATEEKLLGYAPTYAIAFESLEYDKINLDTTEEDPLYLKLIEVQKNWLRSNPYITDIYTMNQNKEGKIFLIIDSETDYDQNGRFDGEREGRTSIGEPYEKDLSEIKSAFRGFSSFTSTPYSDKWGTWVSAFVPIHNKKEEVVGILGVDYDAKQFFLDINRTFLGGLFFFLLLYAGIMNLWHSYTLDKRKNKKLEVALQEAEKAKQAKMKFVSHMSHEIRTPLNGIISLSTLFSERALLKNEIPQSIQILKSCSEQLLELINDILDYSRIESKKMIIENTSFNLYQIIQDSLNVIRTKIKEKDLSLIENIKIETERNYRGDPVKIKQILINFLSNAVKFTQQGSIEIYVTPIENEMKKMIQFQVIDSGVGISNEKLSKLFNEYEQIESSTSRKFGGTGLGLWICKGLIEAMNGKIEVTSELGKGSIFSFQIPLTQLEIQTPCPKEKKNFFRKSSLKVLIVDDNEVNRIVLGKFIEKLGLDRDEAQDGREAVQKHIENNYDLIFMDCNMPVMDGYEATKQIRSLSHDINQMVFIAAVTASVGLEEQENCMAAGMNSFITKPIRMNDLHSVIEKAIENKNKNLIDKVAL